MSDEENSEEEILEEEVSEEENKSEETYSAEFVKPSKIKKLLFDGEQQIRVSKVGKVELMKYLDNAVVDAVKAIINKLPRKSKGENKGELSRITIMPEDFQEKEVKPESESE